MDKDFKAVILFMIFLHIVDDFYLQGKLAKMKQKKWWQEQTDNELYKYDYIMALMIHAFSWTFCIMFPVLVLYKLQTTPMFLLFFGMNFTIHAIVDDHKANKLTINLVQDQLIHIIQILITAFVLL